MDKSYHNSAKTSTSIFIILLNLHNLLSRNNMGFPQNSIWVHGFKHNMGVQRNLICLIHADAFSHTDD